MNTRTSHLRRFVAGFAAVAAVAAASLSPVLASSPNPGCYQTRTLSAGYQITFTETFFKDEVARAWATGDGDIDMYVYDENGSLIVKDTAYDGRPSCSWTPKWTGRFTIKIVNADRSAVDFRLCTN